MNYNFATRNEYLIIPKGLGSGSLPCLREYIRPEGSKIWVSVKPGTAPEHPGTPRNTHGTPRNMPGTLPGTARNSLEQPGTTPEHPWNIP